MTGSLIPRALSWRRILVRQILLIIGDEDSQLMDDVFSGINPSVFDKVPSPNPYILKSNVSDGSVDSPFGKLDGNASYAYHLSKQHAKEVPGGGGTISIVDSRNFPVSKTIAAAVVTLKPGALRELHWHPNVYEHPPLYVQTRD